MPDTPKMSIHRAALIVMVQASLEAEERGFQAEDIEAYQVMAEFLQQHGVEFHPDRNLMAGTPKPLRFVPSKEAVAEWEDMQSRMRRG